MCDLSSKKLEGYNVSTQTPQSNRQGMEPTRASSSRKRREMGWSCQI